MFHPLENRLYISTATFVYDYYVWFDENESQPLRSNASEMKAGVPVPALAVMPSESVP
jgi:hypothetical protein